SIGTNIYFNSFRYFLIDNSLNSTLNSYYNIDINLSYIIKLLSNKFTISLIIKNITNQTYEIIKNYPMPKRNYLISINYNIH
ncbi:MAG TPA: TonB-dependent receptor, partial [Bacteroidota bacterium]|nr:TonB-dependent receptor [Bacteroidota bacterium]